MMELRFPLCLAILIFTFLVVSIGLSFFNRISPLPWLVYGLFFVCSTPGIALAHIRASDVLRGGIVNRTKYC